MLEVGGRPWQVLESPRPPMEVSRRSWGTPLGTLGMRFQVLGMSREALGSAHGRSRWQTTCADGVLATWPVTGSGREALGRVHGDHETRAEPPFSKECGWVFGDSDLRSGDKSYLACNTFRVSASCARRTTSPAASRARRLERDPAATPRLGAGSASTARSPPTMIRSRRTPPRPTLLRVEAADAPMHTLEVSGEVAHKDLWEWDVDDGDRLLSARSFIGPILPLRSALNARSWTMLRGKSGRVGSNLAQTRSKSAMTLVASLPSYPVGPNVPPYSKSVGPISDEFDPESVTFGRIRLVRVRLGPESARNVA